MPLYTYECAKCGEVTDMLSPMDSYPKTIRCTSCGARARKVIAVGHGGIQCDGMNDVPWLASALGNLQPDGEKPIETRGEYKRYLKDKNIIAAG